MKKIISVILAAAMLLSFTTVFAETKTNRAILLCYNDTGTLVNSKLLKADEYGNYDVSSEQYPGTTNKIYYIDTQEFKDIEAVTGEATPAPTETPAPSATPKPSSTADTGSPYEREGYGVDAPALVVDVAESLNSGGEDVYAVTVFYHGQEMTIPVNEELQISTAPTEYAYMQGQTAGSLQKGDVICMTSNIAGNKIRRLDFIFRPTDEDIATGDADYGVNFEKLFTAGGSVAGQWAYQKYGARISNDRYSYAFGIVGAKSNNGITLINKSEDPEDALYITVNPNAYVYVCDVGGREYDCEIGDRGDISALPGKVLRQDTVALSDSYTYNYALVRMVDGVATDIILYNNYNN